MHEKILSRITKAAKQHSKKAILSEITKQIGEHNKWLKQAR